MAGGRGRKPTANPGRKVINAARGRKIIKNRMEASAPSTSGARTANASTSVTATVTAPKAVLVPEKILKKRTTTTVGPDGDGSRLDEYLVKWEGFPSTSSSWLAAVAVPVGLISDFEKKLTPHNNHNANANDVRPTTGTGTDNNEPKPAPAPAPKKPRWQLTCMTARSSGPRRSRPRLSIEEMYSKSTAGIPPVSAPASRQLMAITGATDSGGELTYLCTWTVGPSTLVPARIANLEHTQAVIQFHENHLTWDTSDF